MSDLLIRGMGMPKNCCGCVFSLYTPTGKTPFCKRTGKDLTAEVYFNKRSSDCPLVPVPPHGRLIDANKLIDRLQKQLNEAQAKVRAMGELNIGYTPDMYIVDRNRDMISILIAQAAFLPEEGTR